MPILKQVPYPGSLIRRFRVTSAIYEHVIFPSEDDRVECRNMYGEVILTYTADCRVLDKHKRQIGEMDLNENIWSFVIGKKTFVFDTDLIEAEFGVSEMYIRGEL